MTRRGIKYGVILLGLNMLIALLFWASPHLWGTTWQDVFFLLNRPGSVIADALLRSLSIPTMYDPTPPREQAIIFAVDLASTVIWWLSVGLLIAFCRALFRKLIRRHSG